MEAFEAQAELPWQERQWAVGDATGLRAGTRTVSTITHGLTAYGAPVQNAIHVVIGSQPGPVLYIQAAVHGDEVNNVEILRQLLSSLDPQQMQGILLAVPVVNGPAFMSRVRHNPLDREDMNRVWPGQINGSASSRMAYHLYQQAIRHADYVIDLHTASSHYVLHVVYGAGDDSSRKLAEVFGLEVLLEEEIDQKLKEARFQGKLRNVLNAQGIPAITPELGGANCLEPENVAAGLRGVTNVMKYLQMLPGSVEPPATQQITVRGSHLDRITAPEGGFWLPVVNEGEIVRHGSPLGHLYSVQTFEKIATLLAPYHGYVLGRPNSPVVNFGDNLMTVCPFLE